MQIQRRIIDNYGRITIPSSIRKEMAIEANEEFEFTYSNNHPDRILIKRINHKCIICGRPTERLYKNQFICNNCVADNEWIKS